ncbi:MAG: hypothetical protein ACKOQM_01525 [Novosphingobium sp.]
MRWMIRAIIRTYWLLIPAYRRRKCLFKESCSRHVYRETDAGFHDAIRAFRYRFGACRPGYVRLETKDADGTALFMMRDGSIVRADLLAVGLG